MEETFPSPETPCFDLPSWQDGFQRGYSEGDTDGQVRGAQAARAALRDHLRAWAHDTRLGLRHDLGTPLETLRAVLTLVDTA
jgi:hypothetical protein